MVIDSIDIYRLSLPLVEPFRTACGDDIANECLLVRMASGDDYGWGEAAPGKEPTFSPECAASSFLTARDHLAPVIVGADVSSGADLQERMAHIRGNQFAKAAFDHAWWDIASKLERRPLWDMIGGRKKTIEAGADIGVLEDVDDLIARVGEAESMGYRRVKLKVRPGWDVDVVRTVRKQYPYLTLHVDCNAAYTLEDMDVFERFDSLNLAMIEQPLAYDDILDHAELARRISTPVCLDESVNSPDKARKAVLVGACRWVNIKPGRVGGITPSLAIHDICRAAGVGCWIGGMLETSVGAAHCLSLASLSNVMYPSDIFPYDRFYADEPGRPLMTHDSPGTFALRDDSGSGAEPDMAALERFIIDNAIVR